MTDARHPLGRDNAGDRTEQVRGQEAQTNLKADELLSEGRSLNLFNQNSKELPTGLPTAEDLLGPEASVNARGRAASAPVGRDSTVNAGGLSASTPAGNESTMNAGGRSASPQR